MAAQQTASRAQQAEWGAEVAEAIETLTWMGAGEVNEFRGYDFTSSEDEQTLRVVPIDGEWDCGADIYVFDARMVNLRGATVRGAFSAHRIALVAEAMALESPEAATRAAIARRLSALM